MLGSRPGRHRRRRPRAARRGRDRVRGAAIAPSRHCLRRSDSDRRRGAPGARRRPDARPDALGQRGRDRLTRTSCRRRRHARHPSDPPKHLASECAIGDGAPLAATMGSSMVMTCSTTGVSDVAEIGLSRRRSSRDPATSSSSPWIRGWHILWLEEFDHEKRRRGRQHDPGHARARPRRRGRGSRPRADRRHDRRGERLGDPRRRPGGGADRARRLGAASATGGSTSRRQPKRARSLGRIWSA